MIQRQPRSPIDPVMAVTAFAGPLSPSKASSFTDYLPAFCQIHHRAVSLKECVEQTGYYLISCRQMGFGGPGRLHPDNTQSISTTSSSLIQIVGLREWAGTSKTSSCFYQPYTFLPAFSEMLQHRRMFIYVLY